LPERLLHGSIGFVRAMRGGLLRDWRSLPGRVAGAGLAGAALGAAVAGIWYASWMPSWVCPRPAPGSVDGNICFPLGLWLLAIVVNGVVILAGVWGAFTILRMRPRRATVPGGWAVVVVMVLASAGDLDARKITAPSTPWLAALEAGAGLAAFALVTGGRRAWLAGVLALALIIVAAVQVPSLVRQRQLADARLHDLAALGFPLKVPSVPGYHPTYATASEGVLLVVMQQSIRYPGTTEITVEIAPAGGAFAARELAMCAGPGHSRPLYDACTALGPGRWLLTNADPLLGDAALAQGGGLVTESSASGHPAPVSDSTLIAAVTSLRPASAASLASLG
jgi:hypothetical protein